MKNTIIPEFYGQRELLNKMINQKISDMRSYFKDAGIDETRVQIEAMRELDIIAECEMCGPYFWLAQAIDRISYISPFDILTCGTGNETVIANLLGFTGKAGMLGRIKKTVYRDGYYSQIYYGPIDARQDFNPFNLRLSSRAYRKLIGALSDVLLMADNYSEFAGLDLADFETQRKLNLYISEYPKLDKLTELYHNSAYCTDLIVRSDDKYVLDVICKRTEPEYAMNICEDIKDGVVSYVHPRNREELSYAAGLSMILSNPEYITNTIEYTLEVIEQEMSDIIRDESWMKENQVFLEDYLKDYIDGASGEKFIEMRKACLKSQVFPKSHIDKFIELEWMYACFKLGAELDYMIEE